MIKNIMKNIGLKDVNKALEKYKTDAKNMTTEQLGYYVEDLKNGTGNIGKENLEERIKIYGDELEARNGKKDEDLFDSAGKERPSTQVAYLKGWKDPQLKEAVKKAITTHNATGNNLMNVLYQKGVLGKDPGAKDLYDKLDKMGTTYSEQFINQLAHDPEYDKKE